ncbi:hypothetical protein PanWU01x14_011950, partial [Parasponia andersonii]
MTRTVAMIHAQVTHIDESHHEEPSTNKRILGLFDNDYSSEEENQEWINKEESSGNTCESLLFEIQIIMLLLFIKDHIYDDL